MGIVAAVTARKQARKPAPSLDDVADVEGIADRAKRQVDELRATLAELAAACDGPSGEAFLLSEDADRLASFARGLSQVLESSCHELYMPF